MCALTLHQGLHTPCTWGCTSPCTRLVIRNVRSEIRRYACPVDNKETSPVRLKRAEAAQALGISISAVRKLESAGKLHPQVHPENGTRLYDAAEVEELRARRLGASKAEKPQGLSGSSDTEGEVAARVFARLDKGERLTAIVVTEKLPPDVVRKVAEQWRALKEADFNAPSVPREMALLRQRLQELERLQGELMQVMVGLAHACACSSCGKAADVSWVTRCPRCGDGLSAGLRLTAAPERTHQPDAHDHA